MKMKDLLLRAMDGDVNAQRQIDDINQPKKEETNTKYITMFSRDQLFIIAHTVASTPDQALNNLAIRMKQWAITNGYAVTPRSEVLNKGKILTQADFQELKTNQSTNLRLRTI